MKIKDVCIQTQLTERAVRFYVQQGLLTPSSKRHNSRTYLDFSPEDIARLDTISTLRRAGFTLEEIRSMEQNYSSNVGTAVHALTKRLLASASLYDRLARTHWEEADTVEAYAALLRDGVRSRPLPASDNPQGIIKDWKRRSWITNLTMVLFALLGWRLWMVLMVPIDEFLFSCGLSVLSVFLILLGFPVLALPFALVVGQKCGDWLGEHLFF